MSATHVVNGVHFPKIVPAAAVQKLLTSFKFNDGDILLTAYPHSGMMKMAAIVYLLTHQEDIKKKAVAPSVFQKDVPFLEYATSAGNPGGVEMIEKMSGSRLMKTHLQFSFLEHALEGQKVKIIHLTRNPKDCLTSFYHMHRMNSLMGFNRSFDDFLEMYKKGELSFGDWCEHLRGWQKLGYMNKQDIESWWVPQDVHEVSFEDMKNNATNVIEDIAKFLEIGVTAEQVKKIADLTTFENTKKSFKAPQYMDERVSPFIRKGETGDFKNQFNKAQSDDINRNIKSALGHALFLKYCKDKF